MENRIQMCGCKKHEVSVGQESLVVWRDEYWRHDCALRHAMTEADFQRREVYLERNTNAQIATKLEKLKRQIAHLPCSTCADLVGRNFDFHGNELLCRKCKLALVEIGGEG